MIERIRKNYAMTEKGAKDYVAAVFWSVLVNISKMLPVGVLATALSGIVAALTTGTATRAGLARFLVAGVLALAALFVTFLIQYKALYEATYRESANRRIRLAEVLRQLPLSFFGIRDLTDLTTTIMGDTETLEKAFSHFYPAMHGAILSTALTRKIAYQMVCGFARTELMSGVTTIRTVGGLADFDTRLRDEIAAGAAYITQLTGQAPS